MIRTFRSLSVFLALAATVASATAQEPGASAPADKDDERSTGLPSPIKWTFNFDAGWGSFGFANSLFTNPKEGVKEDLSDQWFEGYVKPALAGVYTFDSTSQLYGKVSAVGERTYGSVPEPFGQDVSSFQVEDLSVGWRSGESSPLGDNAFDFSVGRERYRLGHGFLVFDGAAEGGSRGGYWTNARQAFQFAAIGRFRPGHHLVESFYLDKDELEEHDTGSRVWGLNYEFAPDDHTTVGATFMKWFAHRELAPGRDGLNVVNVRAYTAPFSSVRDLSFEFEYASERNGTALDSNAWTLQGGYQLSSVVWSPKVSYRYAWFQGDDPQTSANEAFDPLFLGFYDWGTWWQGEIAGEYFLSNSNLRSHQIRVNVAPTDAVSGGLIAYHFDADQPRSYGTGVINRDLASEIDAYTDWKLNHAFTVSLLLAYADPGKAVQQATGRTKNFAYGMLYVAYGY